jgi:hypothetical protein
MMKLADVSEVVVPRECVDEIVTHLRLVGRDGHEGLGLWVGRQVGPRFHVTATVVPKQTHKRTADGLCVILPGDALHELNVRLYKEQLSLIAQIHSHPGRAYHSDTDDAYAIATTVGCFSIVVPYFARDDFDISRVATYRLDEKARWMGVSPMQARRLIRIGD